MHFVHLMREFSVTDFFALDSQSNSDQGSSQLSTLPNSLSADELSADNHFKNAYYVFRALCKLSDRDIKDKANTDPKYKNKPLVLPMHLFRIRSV